MYRWKGRVEARERRTRLGSLRAAVVGYGVRARFAWGAAHPACLLVRGRSGRAERVLCVGAGDTYTFITERGQLLSVADELGVGDGARSLVWLIDPPIAVDQETGR